MPDESFRYPDEKPEPPKEPPKESWKNRIIQWVVRKIKGDADKDKPL